MRGDGERGESEGEGSWVDIGLPALKKELATQMGGDEAEFMIWMMVVRDSSMMMNVRFVIGYSFKYFL